MFPNLQILPVDSLILHGQPDIKRVDRIIKHMKEDAVLRDPPIVWMTARRNPCYLVLEGVDCTFALKIMKVPNILGQVIEPGNMVISRALRVNYPLSELMDKKPLSEKNHALQKWLQERFLCRNIRYYEEATILFDE